MPVKQVIHWAERLPLGRENEASLDTACVGAHVGTGL